MRWMRFWQFMSKNLENIVIWGYWAALYMSCTDFSKTTALIHWNYVFIHAHYDPVFVIHGLTDNSSAFLNILIPVDIEFKVICYLTSHYMSIYPSPSFNPFTLIYATLTEPETVGISLKPLVYDTLLLSLMPELYAQLHDILVGNQSWISRGSRRHLKKCPAKESLSFSYKWYVRSHTHSHFVQSVWVIVQHLTYIWNVNCGKFPLCQPCQKWTISVASQKYCIVTTLRPSNFQVSYCKMQCHFIGVIIC